MSSERTDLERTTQSRLLSDRAQRSMVAGVFDPSHYAPPYPVYMTRGEGAYLFDVDGNKYVDMNCAHSALPLGHARPEIRAAIERELANGTYYKQPSVIACELTERICDRIPSVERVALTDSGGKATASAVRVARVYTGRTKFAKFVGGYQGTWESAMFGLPGRYSLAENDSVIPPGVSPRAGDDVVLLEFNHTDAVIDKLDEHGSELAAVIMEPILGDGSLPPAPGFLEAIRKTCTRLGIVLIYDEMVSLGVGRGGAQGLYGVLPDLTAFGKSIGAGIPIGAVGGTADIMAVLDPRLSNVPLSAMFGASFGGHPFAVAAGVAQLDLLDDAVYARLWQLGDALREGIEHIGRRAGLPLHATGVGQYLTMHWNQSPVADHVDHLACDNSILGSIFVQLVEAGYIGSGGCRFQASAAMSDDDVAGYLSALDSIVSSVAARI